MFVYAWASLSLSGQLEQVFVWGPTMVLECWSCPRCMLGAWQAGHPGDTVAPPLIWGKTTMKR